MVKKLNKTELENYRKYHVPGCGNYTSVKIDVVIINIHNSYKHEHKKFEVCWELRMNGNHFICEAEKNKKKEEVIRRVDIVNLSTGDEIEIETNHKIKKEGAVTLYI